MMLAFENGASVAKLSLHYGISEKRVKAILADERNRQLNSIDPFYRYLRNLAGKKGY
jgi:hypothetical protein